MGDSPPFERKSVVRRAAALDFLTNISLGYEKEKPALSDPIPIRDDIAGLKNHEEDNVNVNSKEFPPVRFIERAYGEKEKAAIDFLTNISLDLSVQRADGDTSQEVHTFIPNVVAAGNSYSSTQFPDLGTSFGRTSDMSKTFFPPAYQIYSGEVISKQRTSTSRRSSVDVTGSARFSNTMLDHRIMLTTASGVPLSVFSVISYRDEKLRPKRRRTRSSKYFGRDYFEKIKLNIDIEAVKRRKFAQSFGSLLEPALTLEPKSLENSLYHPFFLDDPELKTGKHRTVITLPCFVSSIIQYSKPSDIKKELNERFRDTHPTVDPTLTLTQIRRLKDRLLRIGEMQDLELSSVACAYVYFEKLVLKNMVNKESRRLVAAACLLLAAKVNDPKEVDYTKLLEAMEKVLDVSKKEVLANEFLIYTALEFTLYIPLWEVMPHLERVVEASGSCQ
ncbi:cyclin-like protein [Powellomyces hirtus]|nr:cyclin-like protein [Powellomyces hirtus]